MELKKSVLVLLALASSSVATAGGFMPSPECTKHPVTVPCEMNAWDVGFTGYWGRLSSENMVVDTDSPVDSTHITSTVIRPNYKFGFGLEGSYHWSTGNDLTLNWMHFNKSFTDNFSHTGSGAIAYENRASFKFDAVNLEMGQRINVGPNWDMRAHFGGQYAKIDRHLRYRHANTLSGLQAGTYNEDSYSSRFHGLGPRAGFDTAYGLSDGFRIVGRSAVSLLMGDLSSHVREYSVTPSARTLTDDFNLGGRERPMVVGLDGKLGLGYASSMGRGSSVMVEGGYAGTLYIDPIRSSLKGNFGNSDERGNFSIGSVYATLKYVS